MTDDDNANDLEVVGFFIGLGGVLLALAGVLVVIVEVTKYVMDNYGALALGVLGFVVGVLLLAVSIIIDRYNND